MEELLSKIQLNSELYNRERILELDRLNLLNSCKEHMPIILTYNENTTYLKNNTLINIPFTKCLCCGKNISFDDFEPLFDVSMVDTQYNNSYEDIEFKYNYYVTEFAKICNSSNDLDEAIIKMNELIDSRKYTQNKVLNRS